LRILAIDPGTKHIGLAISDPTGTIASPLKEIVHVSYQKDAASIADLINTGDIEAIVIGQSIGDNGAPSFEGRRSDRLASAIRRQVTLPVMMWDEAFTTQDARESRILLNVARGKRRGHHDSIAATILLQSYLDVQRAKRGS